MPLSIRPHPRFPMHCAFNSTAEAEKAGIEWRGIVRENYPVPPWEWRNPSSLAAHGEPAP